jgi:hypothetical protein
MKRQQNSCRFSTYYKLEWFDVMLSVWRPLQKSFETIELAMKARCQNKKWRIFEVSESGRKILV